jgi:maltooligosyltrehalose synthase
VDEEIIVVVPRLVHHLTQGELVFPVGDSIWGSTTLIVPGAPTGQRYEHIFTGEELSTIETGQEDFSVLPLAQILGWFPVALLRRLPDRERVAE